MTYYTLHFLLSLLVVFAILWGCRKRFSRFYLVCGVIVVPVLVLRFFYNEIYGTVQSALVYSICYFGAFWVANFYLSLVTFKRGERPFPNVAVPPLFKPILVILFQALLFLICCMVPWAMRTFPMADVDALLFTVFMPVEGADDFVKNHLEGPLVSCTVLFVFMVVGQVAASYFLCRHKVQGRSGRGVVGLALVHEGMLGYFNRIAKFVLKFLLGCAVILLLLVPSILYSPAFKAVFAESVESEFYKKEYVNPLDIPPPAQGNGKNLVVVFVESLVNSFEPWTPEINEWKRKGLSFTPGGTSVAGTGWSIAGITASLCGLPINMPLGLVSESYNGRLPSYLPHATCVMEKLNETGYNQVSIRGVNGTYTQVRQFWKTHGNIDVRDDVYYRKNHDLPAEGRAFWGFEDSRLYEFAKRELDSLSGLDKPFAFYMTTVDTHLPEGFLDSGCVFNEESNVRNVLRCASYMLDDFLQWMSQKSWFPNTVVMVVGDHICPAFSTKAGVPQGDPLRTTAFFLNLPGEGVQKERNFTNLDYAPTILEALGWELPRRGFGLGRSLLSDEKNVLEIYGLDSLNAHIRQRNLQYDYFLLGTQIK